MAGIFDMYGPCNFSDPFWTRKIPVLISRLPSWLSDDFLNRVFDLDPVPITGGVSLEGQSDGPDFADPRQAYALTQISNGDVLGAVFPSRDWAQVDPAENITKEFPPTFIVHGDDDFMVPIYLSKSLYLKLSQQGVKCGMREIPDEGHTFAAKMQKGSRTWNLQSEGFDFLESLL